MRVLENNFLIVAFVIINFFLQNVKSIRAGKGEEERGKGGNRVVGGGVAAAGAEAGVAGEEAEEAFIFRTLIIFFSFQII